MQGRLIDCCKKALKATDKIVQDCEAFACDTTVKTVSIKNNRLKMAASRQSTGLGVRVFKDKALGFASTNSLESDPIVKTAAEAVKIATANKADDCNILPEKMQLPQVDDLYDPLIKKIDIAATLRIAKDLLGSAKQYDKRVTIDIGSVDVVVTSKAIANSRGVEAEEVSSMTLCFLTGMARDGEDVSSFHMEFDFNHMLVDLNAKAVGRRLAEKVVETLGAVKGESFKGQVLFSPESLSSLLCSPVVFNANAENVQKGKSRFVDKLGQKVASERITFTDNGRLKGGLASSAFDREGVAHRELVIIKNGILENFMYDSRSACRENKKSTGHATGGPSGTPWIGPTNVTIDPGDILSDEIISGIKQGIIVTRLSGSPNCVSGDFSGVVKGGFLVRNGEIVKPLTGTIIQGNIYELMQNISQLSKDTKQIFNCKLPYLLVEDIAITCA